MAIAAATTCCWDRGRTWPVLQKHKPYFPNYTCYGFGPRTSVDSIDLGGINDFSTSLRFNRFDLNLLCFDFQHLLQGFILEKIQSISNILNTHLGKFVSWCYISHSRSSKILLPSNLHLTFTRSLCLCPPPTPPISQFPHSKPSRSIHAKQTLTRGSLRNLRCNISCLWHSPGTSKWHTFTFPLGGDESHAAMWVCCQAACSLGSDQVRNLKRWGIRLCLLELARNQRTWW